MIQDTCCQSAVWKDLAARNSADAVLFASLQAHIAVSAYSLWKTGKHGGIPRIGVMDQGHSESAGENELNAIIVWP